MERCFYFNLISQCHELKCDSNNYHFRKKLNLINRKKKAKQFVRFSSEWKKKIVFCFYSSNWLSQFARWHANINNEGTKPSWGPTSAASGPPPTNEPWSAESPHSEPLPLPDFSPETPSPLSTLRSTTKNQSTNRTRSRYRKEGKADLEGGLYVWVDWGVEAGKGVITGDVVAVEPLDVVLLVLLADRVDAREDVDDAHLRSSYASAISPKSPFSRSPRSRRRRSQLSESERC